MQDKDLTRAGFAPRAAAYIVDRIIIFAGLCFLRAPFLIASLLGAGKVTAKDFLFDHSFLDVICWLAASAYLVLLTYYTGGTLGKKLMRLRVEKESGETLSLVDALYRETIGRFLSGILCIGYLMAIVDKRHRAFHDYLCDTRVIYDGVTFSQRARAAAPAAPSYSVPGEETADPSPATEEPVAPAAPYWSVPGQTSDLPLSEDSDPGEA